jgi:uncharacterized protein (TIGR02246 family)
MNTLARLFIAVLVFGGAGCQLPDPSETDTETDVTTPDADHDTVDRDVARAQLDRFGETWVRAVNDRAWDRLAAMYRPDAIVIGPHGVTEGRDAIMAEMREEFAEMQYGEITSDHIRVADSGDLAYVTGTFSLVDGPSGTYASVLTAHEGGWQIAVDAFTFTGNGVQPGQ